MGKYILIKPYQLPGHKERSPAGTVINTELPAVIADMNAGFGILKIEHYRLLEDYKGWLKGTIITAQAPSRIADMNRGIGELVVPEKPAAKPKAKAKPKANEDLTPKTEPEAEVKTETKPAAKPGGGK